MGTTNFDVVAANRFVGGSGDLTTGVIPLDITAAREISSNDTQNLAAHGGIVASDSTPALARVNGATDKALRLTWASSDNTEIAFPPVVKPSDFSVSGDLTVHLMAVMGGSTDTPTVDVQVFDGVGDTEMGESTGALSDSLAEVTATVSASDVADGPGFLNIALVPAAHTTDALHLYAAWVEYSRA